MTIWNKLKKAKDALRVFLVRRRYGFGIRRRFICFLSKICKVPAGQVIPWYLQIIYILLFPIENLYLRQKCFQYNQDYDCVTIYGLRISRQALYTIAKSENITFKITNDGFMFNVTRVDHP